MSVLCSLQLSLGSCVLLLHCFKLLLCGSMELRCCRCCSCQLCHLLL
jgi:hypothetical protein